jgi:phage tail sheath gpL-like
MLCLPSNLFLFSSQLQKETAQATKLSVKCDIIKVAVKKARTTTATTQLELKNQRALVSKLRLEKQELNVCAERHTLSLTAKLAAITAEVEILAIAWAFVEDRHYHYTLYRVSDNASIACMRGLLQGDKQVNLLIQQRDKTQAAADVALAKLHECEQKVGRRLCVYADMDMLWGTGIASACVPIIPLLYCASS